MAKVLKNTYVTTLDIVQENEKGVFSGKNYVYTVETDEPFSSDDLKNALFQAFEIERIYKGELLVTITKELINQNDETEYITTDEVLVKVDAQILTHKYSKFIDWDKCGAAFPTIYEIDRKRSAVEIVDN